MTTHNGDISVAQIDLLTAAVPAPVQTLFAANSHPQLSIEWLQNLANHALDPGERAVLLVAQGPGGELAALPLKLSPGARAHALGNFYTSLYQPVSNSESAANLFRAVFQHLAREERVHSLTLSPMDSQQPLFALLQQAIRQAGWRGVHRYFCFGNWVYVTGGTCWTEYLETRASKLRNTIARRTRKLHKEDRGSIQVITGGEQLEAGIAAYTAIYNSSWKREEPYPDFTPQLLRLAARNGWLRLGLVHYDDQPIAAQIWLVAGGTAYIFKLAYHEAFGHLSPGTLLTAHLMQRVLDEDRVNCIDYLSGDDAYKQDWMTERRERHGIAAYNPRTVRGLVVGLWHDIRCLWRRDPR